MRATIVLLVLAACADPDPDPDFDVEPANAGWIKITTPAGGTTTTAATVVRVAGSAFISRGYYSCCPANAGVTVRWANGATGETGTASSHSDELPLGLGIENHTWFADIPLSSGPNPILVRASDPGGNSGIADVLVESAPVETQHRAR